MIKTLFGLPLFCGLLAATPSFAITIFTANITHDQETGAAGTTPLTTSTGAPRPLSSGQATFTLNTAMTELSMFATIYNIDVTGSQTPNDPNDNLVNAHIHAPAPAGSNGGVVWGFFGSPDNDNTPDNLVVTPFASGVGGTLSSIWNQPEGNGTTLTAQIPNLLNGLGYVNFHTVQFGGGEIRGQLVPPSVPDYGATLWLLGGSLLGLLALKRRCNAISPAS